jgi:adenine-specific DNA methylase
MPVLASKTNSSPAAATEPRTLLEDGFPFAQVSSLAQRDRYCNDYTYAVHKWWARRPPAVIRALLLAAALPAKTSAEDFWRAFSNSDDALHGLSVGDPFMGGATTLVEASRLGADVTGIDVDPLAVRVARVELSRLDREAFEAQAAELLEDLREAHGNLFPGGEEAEPLHYFRLRETVCRECSELSLIYRNLWLARDRGLPGAVVREEGGVAFCPICDSVHHIDAERKLLECCGRRHPLGDGTFSRAGFRCPHCDTLAANEEIRVGQLPSRLIAVEETQEKGYRTLRAPTDADYEAIAEARRLAECLPDLSNESIAEMDSGRPASYGFESVDDLFHPRQRVVLSTAFEWIRERDCKQSIRDALLLAVSNALGANNALCGYATDYGRLSALFSAVRAYSMPVLSVELNPLHASAGRGTLTATLRRVASSATPRVRRHTFDPQSGEAIAHRFTAQGSGRRTVRCQSADRPLPLERGRFDLVLTDPPYFDFIPYSDLSLLYRAWLAPETEAEALGGAPIYPVGEDPAAEFASRLAGVFTNVRSALKPGSPMIFTFHTPHQDAWDAVEKALRKARFGVHAVFPVWADGRGGSHGHAGNCEWDLVFVCRPRDTAGPVLDADLDTWLAELAGEEIEQSDRRNMELGIAMAQRLTA